MYSWISSFCSCCCCCIFCSCSFLYKAAEFSVAKDQTCLPHTIHANPNRRVQIRAQAIQIINTQGHQSFCVEATQEKKKIRVREGGGRLKLPLIPVKLLTTAFARVGLLKISQNTAFTLMELVDATLCRKGVTSLTHLIKKPGHIHPRPSASVLLRCASSLSSVRWLQKVCQDDPI